MVKYFNIEFNDVSFAGILKTLEENGVETEECLAHDAYDKENRLLIDVLTGTKIVESEKDELNKVIKIIMILENGGFDVLEWVAAGSWRNENWHQTYNQDYILPRNNILEQSTHFKNKNLINLDNFNPNKIKYT